MGTKGGPRTDDRGRVRCVAPSAVAGLYAAGNAAASPFGTATAAGGATLGPALVFGFRAGEAAAGGPMSSGNLDGGELRHGARLMQELLDHDTRPVPAVLRAVGDATLGTSSVPRARYTSRAVHEREVDTVWRRVWQMACREEQIPDVGDTSSTTRQGCR